MPRLLKTPQAEKDLIAVGRYISRDNPAAAEKLLDAIQAKLDLLARHPLIGRARPELAPDIRSIPVGDYLIFYLPLDDGIAVVRVIHGARDLRRIFRRRG